MSDRKLVQAYTVCLYVVGVVALIMVPTHQMTIAMLEDDAAGNITASTLRILQILELILSLGCLSTAILRSRNSKHAPALTAAVSILLAAWLPFGTIVFIWWMWRVRHRERCESTVS